MILFSTAYKTAHGQPIVYPRDDLNFAENFLYMMFALPTRPYATDPVAARCLEVILMVGIFSPLIINFSFLFFPHRVGTEK